MITPFVILTGGELLTWVLLNLPTVDWLSGWAAIGTIALMFLMGHYNVAIGEVVVRVMAPDCMGWNAYSDGKSGLPIMRGVVGRHMV